METLICHGFALLVFAATWPSRRYSAWHILWIYPLAALLLLGLMVVAEKLT